MRSNSEISLLTFLLSALPSSAFAQEDERAESFLLDSVTVKAERYTSPVRTTVERGIVWDVADMRLLPQILGNADPIHYAQTLPGIQTNSEYRSGINLEGCDNQHNQLSVNGVPLYNVNHLLGFFSSFNVSHFLSMTLIKGVTSADSPNRLGGRLDMSVNTVITDTVSGNISMGLIASQGTVRMPLSKNTGMSVSLRKSYINLLYGKWLKADEQQLKYAFYDANFSLVHRLDRENRILLDYYGGNDSGGFFEDHYLADIKATWGNQMGALHWLHEKGSTKSTTTAYLTAYRNKLTIGLPDMTFRLPSGITDFGLNHALKWKQLKTGFETIWHNIRPQELSYQGSFNMTDGTRQRMKSLEASIYVDYEIPLSENVKVEGGLRGSCLNWRHLSYGAVDPSLCVAYDNRKMGVVLAYATRHQYLFQAGFSDFGLPTEFWITAGENFKPQYGHQLILSANSQLFNGKFRLSADLFYRRLYRQLAYKGSILDFVNTVYDIKQSMMHGHGRNYGFSLMLNKCTGALTGWVSYTFINARRSFDEAERKKYYPASHERPHEINMVVNYNLGKHWAMGATAVYASGTPFTPAESIFLLNNNLIIKYGEFNSARLHPYIRMDFSANYKWNNKGGREHGINLSVYNLAGRDNELFYYLQTRDSGTFVYRPVTFVMNMLPSVSYYYKF